MALGKGCLLVYLRHFFGFPKTLFVFTAIKFICARAWVAKLIEKVLKDLIFLSYISLINIVIITTMRTFANNIIKLLNGNLCN